MRQEITKPIFNEFIKYVKSLEGKYPPKTKTGEAITYTLNLKEELANYLLDENIEISNNRAEREGIKVFVTSRKNFLFSNTRSGAKSSSIYFSLLVSDKLNNLNPSKYLTYLLDTLCQIGLRPEVIESVLPYSDCLPKELYVKTKPAK